MLQIAQGEIREREVQIEAARADIRVKQNVRSLYKHRQPNTLSKRLCMSVSYLALYTKLSAKEKNKDRVQILC